MSLHHIFVIHYTSTIQIFYANFFLGKIFFILLRTKWHIRKKNQVCFFLKSIFKYKIFFQQKYIFQNMVHSPRILIQHTWLRLMLSIFVCKPRHFENIIPYCRAKCNDLFHAKFHVTGKNTLFHASLTCHILYIFANSSSAFYPIIFKIGEDVQFTAKNNVIYNFWAGQFSCRVK